MWTEFSHAKDKFLRFCEHNHKYSIDWNRDGKFIPNDLSVTSFVKRNFPEFNADAVITRMRSNKQFWKKRKNYRGLSNKDIKAEWAARGLESRTAGTKLHKAIEDSYNLARHSTGGDVGDNSSVPKLVPWPIPNIGNEEFEQFLQYADFMRKRGFIPFRTEWIVYSDRSHSLIGTIDMAYVRKHVRARESICGSERILKLTLVDWKRIKALKRWAQDKGTGLCCDIRNCNFFHYSMQLNTYKYIIENFYEDIEHEGVTYDRMEVDDMWLVVFHPNRKKYMRVKCANMQPLIRELFMERRQQLKSLNLKSV